jgi:hypothetical protein
VLLGRKVLAAIFKAMLSGLLVGSRPLPMTLFPLMRLSGHSRKPAVQPYIEPRNIYRAHAQSTMHAYVICIAHFAYWTSNRHIHLNQILRSLRSDVPR